MHNPHIQVGEERAPRYMLLPGDPGRVPLIGSAWQTYEEVSFNREFRLARGTFDGIALGACSTGIGAPSAEIAFMELAGAGSETFIRVGTCGAVQPEIEIGTLVIHEGAVRLVGSVDAYCERAFPAIANRDVTFALIEACEQLELAYAVGITASVDSFFAGEDNAFPVPLELPAKVPFAEIMRSYGVATFEMEAAALFILGSLFKRRCGSICAVGSNRATGQRRKVPDAIGNAIRAANRAVTILAGWDALRASTGRTHVSASLLSGRRATEAAQ
jgi:uridine phosphorylase